jgi:hypothetical protein
VKNWGWKISVLAILAGLLFLWLMLAPVFSSYLSSKLGMNVSVSAVHISPTGLRLSQFTIENPWKSEIEHAFKADSISSFFGWKHLFEDPSIIDRIEIDQVYLGIEFDKILSTETNWTEILEKMPQPKEGAKEVIVKKLILTNMTVDIRGMAPLGKNQIQTIDRMEFTNVSSHEGFPTREFIARIFGKANLLDYIKNMIPNGPNGIIKKWIPFSQDENKKGQEEPGPSQEDRRDRLSF